MVPCSSARCPCTMAQYRLFTNRPSHMRRNSRAASSLFGHHHDATRFAVEAVNQMWMSIHAKMQTHPADETQNRHHLWWDGTQAPAGLL